MKTTSVQLIAAALALLALARAPAQEIREGLRAAKTNEQASVGIQSVTVDADQMEYFQEQHLIVGRGHVVIERGNERLLADYVKVHTDTEQVEARGNITLDREGSVWRGEELVYNFRTHQGDFGAFVAFYEPFFVRADESKRVATNEFVLHNATITSCDGDDPQFKMQAGEARILDGSTLKAYNAVPYLFGIPFFWLPYWQRSLDPEIVTFYLVPGYSSRLGGFALAGLGYRLGNGVRGITRLDQYSHRGTGVGQDIIWKDPKKDKKYEGILRGYWIDDANPFYHANSEEREPTTTNQRYRLQLKHTQSLSDRDGMMMDANYLSDPFVMEDFFDKEYRNEVQPENRLSVMHRGDSFSAGLLANVRLNDFYENINRLPEANFEVNQLKLGNTPFYYESQNTAGFLQHVYPKSTDTNSATRASYDAFRLDTLHTLYYPTRNFDFLNIMPRVRYEGTLYSKSYATQITTNLTVLSTPVITAKGTNTVLTTTNTITQTMVDNGAGMRHLPQFGVESSFKAFGVITEGPTGIGRDVGLRHVAEPYVNYTFQPEPNLLPGELPQFDAVDGLNMEHDIQLGMRNKLQTKRRGYVQNLVDFDVYTYYRFENPAGVTNDFSNIMSLTRLRPCDWLMLDLDATFNPYTSEFESFNTQFALFDEDASRIAVEHRYTKEINNLISLEIMLFPQDRWSFRVYGRYDLDNSQMQEHSYLIQHKNDCISVGLGLRRLDNETMVWLQFWLTAFPQMAADLGQ
jgi:lipopolysaccharide assembly outer membrane protein LptD (OstA)